MGSSVVADGVVDAIVTTQGKALARTGGHSGLLLLATMTDEEFTQRLDALVKGQARLEQIITKVMVREVDFGVIPGTERPGLYKAGAEKLCQLYGLAISIAPEVTYGDGKTAPGISCTVKALAHVGDTTGPVVAEGVGACSSWEVKYRYRRGDRACPACGTLGTVRRSSYPNKGGKFEGEKGWWCTSCRENWDDPKEPKILSQQVGNVDNPDQAALLNTVVKMAAKRARVDVTLLATATSGRFTQDIEDLPQDDHPPTGDAEKGSTTQQGAATRTTGTGGGGQAKPAASSAQKPAQAAGAAKPVTAESAEKLAAAIVKLAAVYVDAHKESELDVRLVIEEASLIPETGAKFASPDAKLHPVAWLRACRDKLYGMVNAQKASSSEPPAGE